MSSAEDAKPFGAQVYAVVQAHGRRSVLTDRLNYAGIQKFKASSRQKILEIFRGSSSSFVSMLESESAEVIAAYLIGYSDGEAEGMMIAACI